MSKMRVSATFEGKKRKGNLRVNQSAENLIVLRNQVLSNYVTKFLNISIKPHTT